MTPPKRRGRRSIQFVLISHAECEQILRRAGFSEERIEELLRDLPDPIDTERDADALSK